MNKYTISTLARIQKSNEPYQLWGTGDEVETLGRAIIGTAPTPLGPVVVYDAESLVEHFAADYAASCDDPAHRDCDHETEAIEWVEFNIAGAWIGDRTPITLARFCAEHDMQTVACPCPLAELDTWWENRVAEAEKRGIAAPHEGKVA
jgi:hypothetical protein